MAASYLKLFVDSLEKYQKLNDSEFGRLVRAALRYKATGAEPDDLGREALLWDGMRLDIDRDAEKYERTVAARSEAGKKGGRPKKQKKPRQRQRQRQRRRYYPPVVPPRGSCASATGGNITAFDLWGFISHLSGRHRPLEAALPLCRHPKGAAKDAGMAGG